MILFVFISMYPPTYHFLERRASFLGRIWHLIHKLHSIPTRTRSFFISLLLDLLNSSLTEVCDQSSLKFFSWYNNKMKVKSSLFFFFSPSFLTADLIVRIAEKTDQTENMPIGLLLLLQLLCWMHRKFRQNTNEALKALVIGKCWSGARYTTFSLFVFRTWRSIRRKCSSASLSLYMTIFLRVNQIYYDNKIGHQFL